MTFLAVFLFLAVLQQKPQAPPPAAPELRFAWPVHVSATVESERRKEQRQGKSAPKVSELKMRYRMYVLPHAKGRLIRYDGYELLGPTATPQNKDDVSQIVSALTPNLIVTSEGAFAGIEDVAVLRAVMEKLIAPLKKSATGVPGGLQELTAALTSKSFLQGMAAQEWQALVQAWLGVPLTSETITFENDQPIPLFPDMTVTVKGTAKMTSSSDQKSVEAMVRRILRGDKALEGVTIERYDVNTVLRVTLEVDTMLPHDFSMTRTLGMIFSMPGQGRVEGTQSENRITRFTYEGTSK